MTQAAPTPCVVFDVDGTLAEFDADRLGHLGVKSGRGQDSTLTPWSLFWPPVLTCDEDMCPSEGRYVC